MKKHLFIFLLIACSIGGGVLAQSAQKPDAGEQNLRRHVNYLASDRLAGRRTGEVGGTSAAGYVMNAFASAKLKGGVIKNGKRLYLQTFPYKPRNSKGEIPPDAKEVEAYNVIGILEGTDPFLRNEAIVIGAHYDHLGRGGMGSLAANSSEIHHGADDNASGTAAVIELARQFAKAKNNKRTLIFISFGGEEEGLLGSKYYVNNPVFPLEKTVAMINMDMIGRLNGEKLNIGGIGTASEWKGLVEGKNMPRINPLASDGNVLPAIIKSFTLQLNEDGFGPSDHSSFYGKQIPVLFFFTGTHLDYHKPSDTADKINYEGLKRITTYVSEIVKAIDLNPKRPTYTVAKSSGTGEGRRSATISLGTIPSYSETTDGMTVDGVRDDSPAAKIGMKGGDRIVKLAGKDVHNIQDYMTALNEMKADIEYEIVYVRNSQRIVAKIVPASRK